MLDQDAQLLQRVELRRWPVIIGGQHGFDALLIEPRHRTRTMFALDRVEPRQVACLRRIPQTLKGGVLLVGRDQCRQRAVAGSHDLRSAVLALATVQGARIGRIEFIGTELARQRDARAAPAAEIEPHLAVTVAPPLNERETWSSPEHLCHPNCGLRLRRCQHRHQRRRQWVGDQLPYRVAARPMQGDARSIAVG